MERTIPSPETLARWKRQAKLDDAEEIRRNGFTMVPSRTALVNLIEQLIRQERSDG